MQNSGMNIGRRTLIAAAGASAVTTRIAGAQVAAPKAVPRNRTYIVASTVDGPVLTNVNNANFFAAGVDLRNGMMYATEPLFWYNLFRNELIPWLAESYAYNDDFTALTIKLRAGAAWSDGHPFTARDVAFTYNMLIENGHTQKNLRQAALFADRANQAEVVDDLTVQITFTRPDPRHLFAVTVNYFAYGPMWVPEHIWSKIDDKAGFTFFDLAKGLAADHVGVEDRAARRRRRSSATAAMTGGVRRPVSASFRRRSGSSPCRAYRATISPRWRCRTRSISPPTCRTSVCCRR